MNKDDLIRIVDNPEMIPGIYNYCDRWCERCHMTSKCSNFALEQEQYPDGINDTDNEIFWDKLHEMFQITIEMIHESATEMGIDLNNLDEENAETEITEKAVEEKITRHICATLSSEYLKAVGNWFDEVEDLLSEKETELLKSQELGIKNDEAAQINDIMEVIRWYQYQIHVKIRRALHGKFDSIEEDPDYPKDSDGSAKVALIGIDRSIAAWGKALTFFPDKEDDTLELLVTLEKLRRQTEDEFPDARAFKRAGFDD